MAADPARVEIRGWVTDEELASLYRRARILLAPTLYEGFGIDGLEAFASGTPVIAGDVPASREVLGEAAWFVDPRDTADIARALAALMNDVDEWERRSRAARERSEGFTWERTASGVASVLSGVLGKR